MTAALSEPRPSTITPAVLSIGLITEVKSDSAPSACSALFPDALHRFGHRNRQAERGGLGEVQSHVFGHQAGGEPVVEGAGRTARGTCRGWHAYRLTRR